MTPKFYGNGRDQTAQHERAMLRCCDAAMLRCSQDWLDGGALVSAASYALRWILAGSTPHRGQICGEEKGPFAKTRRKVIATPNFQYPS